MQKSLYKILLVITGAAFLLACNNAKQVFTSDCNENVTYRRIPFTELINNLKKYDKQYVEVSGKYV